MVLTLKKLLGKEIKTERLILKKMTSKDTNLLRKLYKEKGFKWYNPNCKVLPSRKEIKHDLSQNWYYSLIIFPGDCEKFYDFDDETIYNYLHYYAIIHKKSKKFLGMLNVEVDRDYDTRCRNFTIAYFLHQKYERNGYMTEAVRGVCDKIRYCRIPYRISLRINKNNKKSLRVAQKCGFNWKDTDFLNIYSLIPPRYKERLYSKNEEVDWDNPGVEKLDWYDLVNVA